MNIKVNNQFLDFDDAIEIERQVKLFEQVSDTVGDFSYSFTIPATSKNRSIFELYSIDQTTKIIYQKIPAVIENSGIGVYFGFLKVEKDRESEIDCSFFSGNNNWFNDLDFNIRDFDFSEYDSDWNKSEIVNLESASTGTIFPVIDTGALSDRTYVNWHIDDMHPFVYVKSIIQTLLNKSGIKLDGDILQDWRYNRLITSNAAAATPQQELTDRSVYVNKSSTQSIPAGEPGNVYYTITFPNTTLNYYPGSLWNTGTDEFTADVDMFVDIKVTIQAEPLANNILFIEPLVNGNSVPRNDGFSSTIISFQNFGLGPEIKSGSRKKIRLNAGDALTISALFASTTATADVYSGTVTITPTRLYKSFTQYLLPDVKAKDFVSSVFSLFNTVINYNGLTKVLKVNLFNNLIREPELDISSYVKTSTIEDDYTELISDYGKDNLFKYNSGDEEATKRYNNGSLYPFGSGVINSNNELTQPIATVIDSPFTATIENNINPFKTYLPRFEWRSISEAPVSEEGIVADNSGPSSTLNFIMPGLNIGDLVRIFNSTNQDYNGEWIVSAVTTVSGQTTEFRVSGLLYTGDATVDVVQLIIDFNDSDEQALLLALPNYPLSSFTNGTLMFYADSSSVSGASTPATAYFYKPIQGLSIDDYKESLSFGTPDIENTHQITMIESYWRDFSNILQDPVKLIAETYYPLSVFNQLFDGPIRIRTSKFNCRFYVNRVTSYQNRHLSSTTELIKI